ncbi:TIGR04063 family PEP-CTERM/XrtA system glycosyltransferase [Janthinobacterium agaricidamnosum]|uniref:Glycosyl transferases group 1 family protein n=1 Tax=Janthinobacterium agaricidamnosum NBRC 102515 = DSM 9628 TaxID=1349767 RepID=W0V6N1_9BURK|nr:TIGR04063 family PEP-CTERM/XrtA system glycosyltransferase [Janthinobacterium agaricidamnosum]CDG83275.1 glycosyl transferases group 1 family protein [Janthinobacterium agaricidamnosum NBRC 102515 = DSM 9628]
MRILHILDHSLPLQSGYTFRTLAILKQQRAFGWSTSHLTSAKQSQHRDRHDQQSGLAEQRVDGWHFFRTAPSRHWWACLPLLGHYSIIIGLRQRLRQLAQQLRPDILHAHSPALNAIAALSVGRALGIPVVYEIRAFWEDAAADHGTGRINGLRYRLSRALESYALHRVDAVTTICEGLRIDLAARGIPAAKITVIPNAVDSSAFERPSADGPQLARQLGLHGHLVLGFIGSFYAYEGLALLLQAMPRLLAAFPSLRLLLAGGGPQEAELMRLSERLGISRQVVFAGRVPHAQIGAYYQMIDMLVYPRLPMRLTELVTPLKPLEAMAQGRLVVASDVGGHRELISHGKTGILFEAGKADALADAVLQLLHDADSWPFLRRAARHYVLQERNWSSSVSRYAGIYQRLISNNQSHQSPSKPSSKVPP